MRLALSVLCRTKRSQASSGFYYSILGLRRTGVLLSLTLFAGCQHRLDDDTASAVVELTEASFYHELMESDRPVLVEFWAPWCQPCLEMQPAMEQLANELRGRVKVCRLNIDEAPDIAASFDVNAPPVFLLFRDGEVVKRRSGKQTKSALQELISDAFNVTSPLP